MKFLALITSILAVLTFAVPAAFAVDNSISSLCDAGAPAAYSRAGGYCDQVASNKSLNTGGSFSCPEGTIQIGPRECICEPS